MKRNFTRTAILGSDTRRATDEPLQAGDHIAGAPTPLELAERELLEQAAGSLSQLLGGIAVVGGKKGLPFNRVHALCCNLLRQQLAELEGDPPKQTVEVRAELVKHPERVGGLVCCGSCGHPVGLHSQERAGACEVEGCTCGHGELGVKS